MLNHQQQLITVLAGIVFVIGALMVVGGVAMRRLAWTTSGAGICIGAGLYAYVHWSR